MYLLFKVKRFFETSTGVFLFAGQGTQQKGMLSKIQPKLLQEVNLIGKNVLGIDLQEVSVSDTFNRINQTEITQPLLLLSHYLHFQQKFASRFESKDFMIGHSLGEYSALVAAKSLSLQDGLRLVHKRGLLMKKYTTCPHGMLIVKYKLEKQNFIKEYIKKHDLEIACYNSRTNLIVAGPKQRIATLSQQLKKNQVASMSLPVSTAFHCRNLENMKQQFAQQLSKLSKFESPRCKIIRNYDCKIYQKDEDIRQGLILQLTNPVQFHKSAQIAIRKAHEHYQVGHKNWISKFYEETLNDYKRQFHNKYK